jgi:copper(I)-binding protein
MKYFFLLTGLALLGAGTAQAHDYKQGSIAIEHPWARPTPEGARAGAAYLSLQNSGNEADTLLSAETPVSASAQFHETIRDGDIMKMREIRGGVVVPPGGSVSFKPGGYHIMLVGLKQRLDEGQHIPMTLTFAKAGPVRVEVYVEKQPGSQPQSGAMNDHDMSHMH